MRKFAALASLIMLTGLSQVASAKDPGTHFLVEPYSGMMFNQAYSAEETTGLEAGAMLAIGGKLRGFSPRFYLYFKASHARFGSDEIYLASRDAHACVERSYTRLIGGLRTVIPLFWHMRLNLEFGGGSMFSENNYKESGRQMVSYDENLTVLEFGIGLNLRLYRWLSVGLMYDYTMVAEDELGDMIATMLGEANNGAEPGWSHLSATLGFHF